MSQYQRFTSKEPSDEFSDYMHDKCPDCGGCGNAFTADGMPLHTVQCPTCKGTGHGKVNQSKLVKGILIAVVLFAIGYVICKLLNI